MDKRTRDVVAKVPQVTLLFWVIKILATTLGETGGDAVTMSWLGETTDEAKGTGYLIGTAIFGVLFVVAVLVQIRAKKFHPSSTGSPLSPRPRWERPWRITARVRLASATPAARPSCWSAW